MNKTYIIALLSVIMIVGIIIYYINLLDLREELESTKKFIYDIRYDLENTKKEKLSDMLVEVEKMKYESSMRIVYEDMPDTLRNTIKYIIKDSSYISVAKEYLSNEFLYDVAYIRLSNEKKALRYIIYEQKSLLNKKREKILF